MSKSPTAVTDIPQFILFSTDRDFECAAIKWSVNKTAPLIVLSIYRSPSGNIQTFLLKLEHILEETLRLYGLNAKIIAAGDINIDLSNDKSTATQQFKDLITRTVL